MSFQAGGGIGADEGRIVVKAATHYRPLPRVAAAAEKPHERIAVDLVAPLVADVGKAFPAAADSRPCAASTDCRPAERSAWYIARVPFANPLSAQAAS